MTERLANHSRINPEPFPTSRARADQGAGNKGAWIRESVVETPKTKCSLYAPVAIGLGR